MAIEGRVSVQAGASGREDGPWRDPWFWGLFALAVLLGSAPALTGQWLSAHEGPGYLLRAAEFSSLLAHGEWYPRWCPDFYWGYGYPFFVFYSPGLFYLTAILMFLGARADAALHAMTILGTAAAFLGGYRFCRLFARDHAARAGAVLTALATYRFVQYFIRGDLAEGFATCLVPWALAEAVLLCRRRDPAAMARLAVLLALVFYGHTLTAVAVSAALAFTGLGMLVMRDARAFGRVGLASLAGLALAGAQWIPALFERRFVQTERMLDDATQGANWRDHFVMLWQRFRPGYGFGLSVPGGGDRISFASSYAVWALIVVALVLVVRRASFMRRAGPLMLGWLGVNLMMLSVSRPVWAAVPFVAYFQFPWRFLLLELVLGAAVASAALDEVIAIGPPPRLLPVVSVVFVALAGVQYPLVLSEFADDMLGRLAGRAHAPWWGPHALVALVVAALAVFAVRARGYPPLARLTIVGGFLFAVPPALFSLFWATYQPLPLDDALLRVLREPIRMQRFTIEENGKVVAITTAAQDEYRPRTARVDVSSPPDAPGRMTSGEGAVRAIGQRGARRRFEVDVTAPGRFEIAWLVYPGARAEVDGREAPIAPDDLGLVAVDLPAGRHLVDVRYGISPTQSVSYVVTLLGALAAAGFAVMGFRARASGGG